MKNSLVYTTIATFLVVIALLLMPSQYKELKFPQTEHMPVLILSVNNDAVQSFGLMLQGEQYAQVQLLKGKYKGQEVAATNLMMGSLESDKVYKVGDKALATVTYSDAGVMDVTLVDHYRLDMTLWLAIAFGILLVSFAGWIGVRSILSFILTVLAIWKILIPAYLNGISPLGITLLMTIVLTISIIVLVFGWDRRALSASLGSVSGTLLTVVLSYFLVEGFKIHGAVMPYSESLLYSGYAHINLTQIFMSGIFLACSGAMMDVAVDITSAMSEIMESAPDISRRALLKSGINVGRAVMGTMTTTLLLAYTGGFTGLLMVFMAKGTPIVNILSLKFVSSEILHTLIGSIGLVTVAPFTALIAAYALKDSPKSMV